MCWGLKVRRRSLKPGVTSLTGSQEYPYKTIGLFSCQEAMWGNTPAGRQELFVFESAGDEGFTRRELLQAVAAMETQLRSMEPDEDHVFFEGLVFEAKHNGWFVLWGS